MVTLAAGRAEPARVTAEQFVRFTVFSVRPITDIAVATRADQPAGPLVFYPTARSPHYEFRGMMPWGFVSPTGKRVGEVVLPPDVHDALLLFSAIEPAPDNGPRYHITVFDDGASRHRPGGMAAVNLSGLPLSGMIDGKPAEVRAGLNPVLMIGRSAKISLRTKFKGRSYQSYAGTVELAKGERALLILFPPYYAGSLEVQPRLLVDAPPP